MQHQRLAQYRWYLLDGVQFAAIALTTLALMPAGAQVFELSGKLALSPADYVMVQSVHHAWVLFASTMLVASAAIGLHSYLVSRNATSFGWSMVALVLVGAAQIVFWAIAYPANAATDGMVGGAGGFRVASPEVGVRFRRCRHSQLCRASCSGAFYRREPTVRQPVHPGIHRTRGRRACSPDARAFRRRRRQANLPTGRPAEPRRLAGQAFGSH